MSEGKVVREMNPPVRSTKPASTILVIDDEEAIRENLADFLELKDYHVLKAVNGKEGLDVVKRQSPDLIICDIMMPEMDGYEFQHVVRQNPAWMTIPIIYLSAKAEKEDIRKGYLLGVEHYLTKPFDPEELLLQVQTRLRRAAEIQDMVQKELQRVEKPLLNLFSHELRTPLSLIHSYLETYEAGKSKLDREEAGEVSRIMQRTMDRMVKLIEDLMLIVYIDSGAVDIEIHRLYQPIDLSLEINALVDEFKDTAERRGIRIVNTMPENLTLHGHSHFIRNIFQRLIDNAIKFGSIDGHVWIEVEALREGVRVTVRDDGMGIPKDEQELIFGRFKENDQLKVERLGVGLGLAIAAQLTRLHGGEIQVQSELGIGSSFKVWLPYDLGLG